MPIECVIGLIVWAIFALIIVLFFEAILRLLFKDQDLSQVFLLIRLLVGLLVLLQALECLGLLSTGYLYHRRL